MKTLYWIVSIALFILLLIFFAPIALALLFIYGYTMYN